MAVSAATFRMGVIHLSSRPVSPLQVKPPRRTTLDRCSRLSDRGD